MAADTKVQRSKTIHPLALLVVISILESGSASIPILSSCHFMCLATDCPFHLYQSQPKFFQLYLIASLISTVTFSVSTTVQFPIEVTTP